jgi:methylthioribulose-1-phosphate dehydratase
VNPTPFPVTKGAGSGGSASDPAHQLTACMAEIHRRGWCDGTGGNFSCVLSHTPVRLLMAPSGVDKGQVTPDALIEVDGQGAVVRGQGRASAETLLHLAIVETTQAGAVLHTHSQSGTLLSAHHAPPGGMSGGEPAQAGQLVFNDLEMLKGLEGISTHATRVELPILANDQNLEALSERARPHLPSAPHGLLIAGHGLYAWGRDLAVAMRHLEILEFLLEQQWRRMLLKALTGGDR